MEESGDEDFVSLSQKVSVTDTSKKFLVTDSTKKYPKLKRAPTTEMKENFKSQKSTPRARRPTGFQHEWLQKTDANGDKVSEYLRQVEGEPDYVRCVADNHRLRISTRGWSQISDHATSASHKVTMTEKKG